MKVDNWSVSNASSRLQASGRTWLPARVDQHLHDRVLLVSAHVVPPSSSKATFLVRRYRTFGLLSACSVDSTKPSRRRTRNHRVTVGSVSPVRATNSARDS